MRFHCEFHTAAAAEQVISAYTDFTARRLEIWRDTLRPENYVLLDEGPSWAVVREGSLSMGVVLRYDFTEPRTVRWSVLESDFCDRGTGMLTVRPVASGGTDVAILIEERGGKGLRGRVILLLKGFLGPWVLRHTSKRTLDRLAE